MRERQACRPGYEVDRRGPRITDRGPRTRAYPAHGPHWHAPPSSPAPTAASAARSPRRSPAARSPASSPACATPTASRRSPPPPARRPRSRPVRLDLSSPRVDRRVRRGDSARPRRHRRRSSTTPGSSIGGLLEEQDTDADLRDAPGEPRRGHAPHAAPGAAGDGRARPRHDRQQHVDRRLRLHARRHDLRGVEGRRRRASARRCGASCDGPGSSVMHVVTPGVDTDMLDETDEQYGRYTDTSSWDRVEPDDVGGEDRRRDRVRRPHPRAGRQDRAARSSPRAGPASLLDAAAARMFSRQPRSS